MSIRKVEEQLVTRLKRRAALNGQSVEAEHREFLREVLSADTAPDFNELAAQVRKLTKRQEQIAANAHLREGCEPR